VTERLSDSVVRRRAKSGVFFVGSWGVVNLAVGFFGSILLARMLVPRDFGIVALGITIMAFAGTLADGGLAGGLIRRERPPERAELRAALGLQLTIMTIPAVVAAAVALLIGGDARVVALMMVALPVGAWQTPGRVVMSRELRIRPLATVEALGVFAYYLWAVGGVLAGLGVWALASAVLVKGVVVAGGVVRTSRLGLPLPTYRGVRALKPVIAFGLRFQAVGLANMIREQGLNSGVAAIGGVATLGLWTLTRRLLEFPLLLFEPLHRVSFPLLSHLRTSRQDPSRLLERTAATTAAASGLVLVSLAAAAPELVPAVFGEQWRPVASMLQWLCAALLIFGPFSVVGVGFLYAAGAPSLVLRATVLHTLTLFAITFPLLPVLGPEAIGIGAVAGATAEAMTLALAIRGRTNARLIGRVLPTLAVAAVAGTLGTLVTTSSTGLLAGVAGGTAGAIAYVAIMLLVRRAVAVDTVRLIADTVRSGLTRDDPSAAAEPSGGDLAPVPVAR
jgi:O-antigen/teichoic acid export membrane protein